MLGANVLIADTDFHSFEPYIIGDIEEMALCLKR